MADLARYGVRVRYLTSLELRHHETMQVHYRALSVADAEALVIARADNAVLLTGDGRLRKAALDSGVDVRGVIGELKRLVAAVVIDPPEALTALETIVASGSRLPHDEVRPQLTGGLQGTQSVAAPGQNLNSWLQPQQAAQTVQDDSMVVNEKNPRDQVSAPIPLSCDSAVPPGRSGQCLFRLSSRRRPQASRAGRLTACAPRLSSR